MKPGFDPRLLLKVLAKRKNGVKKEVENRKCTSKWSKPRLFGLGASLLEAPHKPAKAPGMVKHTLRQKNWHETGNGHRPLLRNNLALGNPLSAAGFSESNSMGGRPAAGWKNGFPFSKMERPPAPHKNKKPATGSSVPREQKTTKERNIDQRKCASTGRPPPAALTQPSTPRPKRTRFDRIRRQFKAPYRDVFSALKTHQAHQVCVFSLAKSTNNTATAR